ncbi:MAG: hypothetical protein AB1813_12005 [Verrucomicrobiota bacterium]
MKKGVRNKVVFVLGAGFVAPAHGPQQSELLDLILKRPISPLLREFFVRVFHAHTARQRSMIRIEDVFTVLDRAIGWQENVRGLSPHQADELRISLVRDLVRELNARLHAPPRPYMKLAKRLAQIRIESGTDRDPFSFISFNWDMLFDLALHRCCLDLEAKPPLQVDYCCFHYALEKQSRRTLNTTQQVAGRLHLKLLRLHGSTHWLVCPQCAKLFVWFQHQARHLASPCLFCREAPPLQPLLITPTLLKDLQSIQLKTVWHNALTELQEAAHLVFVGYSLPLADFEFRYLLAKSVSPDARITVITSPSGIGPTPNPPIHCEPVFDTADHIQMRYASLFGNRKIEYSTMGAEGFLDTDPELWMSR